MTSRILWVLRGTAVRDGEFWIGHVLYIYSNQKRNYRIFFFFLSRDRSEQIFSRLVCPRAKTRQKQKQGSKWDAE